MKLVLAALVILGTVSAQAEIAQPNPCTSSILNVQDWSAISDSASACLSRSADFKSGLSMLCQADQTQLSIAFVQFLKYQQEYLDADHALRSLPLNQQTAALRNKVQTAKENWDTLGNRSVVSIMLFKMKRAFAVCGGTN